MKGRPHPGWPSTGSGHGSARWPGPHPARSWYAAGHAPPPTTSPCIACAPLASCGGGIPRPHEHETKPHISQVTTDELLASIMVQELSMLVAPALSILFLLLGALGVLQEALAVGLALWNGVVQLIGWGIDVGRKRGQPWPAALLTGLVYGAF